MDSYNVVVFFCLFDKLEFTLYGTFLIEWVIKSYILDLMPWLTDTLRFSKMGW